MERDQQVWLAAYTAAITAGSQRNDRKTAADNALEDFHAKFGQRSSWDNCGGEEEEG